MPYTLGIEEAFDVLEGIVAGGILGLATFVVSGAVASLPGAFITVAQVQPLSVLAGALAFVGVAVHQIRARNETP